jgi:hypothetical protein
MQETQPNSIVSLLLYRVKENDIEVHQILPDEKANPETVQQANLIVQLYHQTDPYTVKTDRHQINARHRPIQIKSHTKKTFLTCFLKTPTTITLSKYIKKLTSALEIRPLRLERGLAACLILKS